MEGRANDGYAWDRLVRRRQGLKRLTRSTLLRLRRLTLQKLAHRLWSLIYKKAILLVVVKKLESVPCIQAPGLPIECRFLDHSYIRQISGLNGLSIERIAEFYAQGSSCLGAFYQDKLVGFSWCHHSNHHFPFFSYCLEVAGGVYIGPDYVAADFRGHRIHGYLLTMMCQHLYQGGYRVVWSSVLRNNHASIKGLRSAGFLPHQQIEVTRIFKSMARKKIIEVAGWQ